MDKLQIIDTVKVDFLLNYGVQNGYYICIRSTKSDFLQTTSVKNSVEREQLVTASGKKRV